MRSSELASIAGVTVRALRHYHQLGILQEPPRSANGYREYDVHHLVRVLRITRLAGLGFPLQQLPGLLDQPDEDPVSQLDQLDAELAARIARLTAQRELVARLRRDRAAPDLPPELAPYAALLTASGTPPRIARLDREQLILLAHLVGAERLPAIARLYGRLAEPGLLAAATEVSVRFAELDEESGDEALQGLADDLIAVVAAVAEEFSGAEHPLDLGDAAALLAEHSNDLLNSAQKRVLALVESRLPTT